MVDQDFSSGQRTVLSGARPAAFLALLATLSLASLSCSPHPASIDYDRTRTSLEGEPVGTCVAPSEQGSLRSLCGTIGVGISTKIHDFARGRVQFAFLWSPCIAVVVGLFIAWAVIALGKRGKFGDPLLLGLLLAGYLLAGGVGYLVFRWLQMPDERALVSSDWILRDLKELERIPATPDKAVAATTCNCVDRIQDIADGRVDDSAKPLRDYQPFWSSAPPLPTAQDDTKLLSDNTYIIGMQLRAADLTRLLDAGDVNPQRRTTSVVEILDNNIKLRQALQASTSVLYRPVIYGWPRGVPIAAIVLIGLVVPLAARLFIRIFS